MMPARIRRAVCLLLAFAVTLGLGACAPSGGPDESRLRVFTLASEILGKDMISQVYLPEGYDAGGSYPVLYFLPSNGGSSYTVILHFGIAETADRLTREGRIAPMILVALGIANSFGMNTGEDTRKIATASGKTFDEGRYADYILEEAIPYVEANFSVDPSREARFLGGYSMGGLAALHLAFTRPERFSRVGGHSPSLFVGDFYDVTVSDWLYPDAETRARRDPLLLAQSADLSGLTVYLDTDDQAAPGGNIEGCQSLYEILTEAGIPAENHLFAGTHGFAYCSAYMERYLLFYGALSAPATVRTTRSTTP